MIGSGKTTTAGHLADWLARRGENVRAFDEGAADHPIRTRRVDELLAAPAPGDPGVYSAGQWRRLVLAEPRLRAGQPVGPPPRPARPRRRRRAVPGLGAGGSRAVRPVPVRQADAARPAARLAVRPAGRPRRRPPLDLVHTLPRAPARIPRSA